MASFVSAITDWIGSEITAAQYPPEYYASADSLLDASASSSVAPYYSSQDLENIPQDLVFDFNIQVPPADLLTVVMPTLASVSVVSTTTTPTVTSVSAVAHVPSAPVSEVSTTTTPTVTSVSAPSAPVIDLTMVDDNVCKTPSKSKAHIPVVTDCGTRRRDMLVHSPRLRPPPADYKILGEGRMLRTEMYRIIPTVCKHKLMVDPATEVVPKVPRRLQTMPPVVKVIGCPIVNVIGPNEDLWEDARQKELKKKVVPARSPTVITHKDKVQLKQVRKATEDFVTVILNRAGK